MWTHVYEGPCQLGGGWHRAAFEESEVSPEKASKALPWAKTIHGACFIPYDHSEEEL
jgi:hypothetical protein